MFEWKTIKLGVESIVVNGEECQFQIKSYISSLSEQMDKLYLLFSIFSFLSIWIGWQNYCKERYIIETKHSLKSTMPTFLAWVQFTSDNLSNNWSKKCSSQFHRNWCCKVSNSQFKIDDNFAYKFYANNHEYAL